MVLAGRWCNCASCAAVVSEMRSCTSELSLARPVSAASRRDDTFREVHISVIAFKLVCDLPEI